MIRRMINNTGYWPATYRPGTFLIKFAPIIRQVTEFVMQRFALDPEKPARALPSDTYPNNVRNAIFGTDQAGKQKN